MVRCSILYPAHRIAADRVTAGPEPLKGKTMNITTIANKLSAWRRYRTSVRELSRLSDRELSDLGIGRADIEFVARKAVRARFAG
jgi:uncharacterized protein YjiS (DUF1127 family)